MSLKRVAHGDLLFRGDANKEAFEFMIAQPIVIQILEQMIKFCKPLPEDQMYLIKWEIIKGELTK
jgi:hypothetical protein